jgi:hypothetical protein
MMRALVLILWAALAWGQAYDVIASDDFTTGVAQNLSDRSGWTNHRASGAIWNTTLDGGTYRSNDEFVASVYRWAGAGTFTANQFADAKVVASGATSRYAGVAVRLTGDGTSSNGMFAECDVTNCRLRRLNNNTVTTVWGPTAHGQTIPFFVRLEAVGNNYTVRVGPSLSELIVPSGYTASYADFSGGVPGVSALGPATSGGRGDDWRAGNIVSSGPAGNLMVVTQ